MRDCPNCKLLGFAKDSSVSIDINETLDRWEVQTNTRFSKITREEYSSYKEISFYKCVSCKFGAFVPACAGTSNFYNDITIEGNYYVDDKWEFIKTFKLIKKAKIKSLLDYGCGGGAFLKAASKIGGIDITGYDQNPQSKLSLDNSAITFVSEVDELPENGFDLITAFQILEHLEDPFSVLEKINKNLKENGIVVISVPNSLGPIRHFPFALTEIPPHHVNRFNAPSLAVFLSNAGFKIEEFSYEPLSRILWKSYLPVIIENMLSEGFRKVFIRLNGREIVLRIVSLLEKTPFKSIPIKGHSVFVVARKCAV